MVELFKKLIFSVIIVQILLQCCIVKCEPEPGKGKGKALGAGLLAGGLAGAAMGHLLTRPNAPAEQHVHHHYPNGAPNAAVPPPNQVPQPRPSTIIERGETLPNGCYKQIIKEADLYDYTRFTEEEQLICPPNVQAPSSYVHPIPVAPQQPQPVQPNYHVIPVQPFVPIQPVAPTQPIAPLSPYLPHYPEPMPQPTNVSDLPPNVNDPSQFPPLVPGQIVPIAPLAPVPQLPTGVHPATVVVTHHVHPQPAILHPQQPADPTIQSTPATSQVITLSKKTGFYADDKKKKNNANSLLNTNYAAMFLLIVFIHLLH